MPALPAGPTGSRTDPRSRPGPCTPAPAADCSDRRVPASVARKRKAQALRRAGSRVSSSRLLPLLMIVADGKPARTRAVPTVDPGGSSEEVDHLDVRRDGVKQQAAVAMGRLA